MDIGVRDVLIQRIESEIVRIQVNMTTRLIELKKRKEDSLVLTGVYNDYKRYHDIIRQQREDQTKTLQFLLEYLENSMDEAGLTEEANEDAKRQYKAIEEKLRRVRDSLEEMIASVEKKETKSKMPKIEEEDETENKEEETENKEEESEEESEEEKEDIAKKQ
jgi:transcription initiation factor TFIIIB Brf1 subunit/transcription initiation factor TFIIB